MNALTLALGLGLVACCTSSPKPGGPPRDRAPDPAPVIETDAKEPPVPAAPPTATLTFVDRKRERPPLSTVSVDASLRNPGERARWFLLPASAAKGQVPIATSSYGVTLWSFPGTGNVVVANFVGASSFYAIQLPPGAEVELRNVKIKLAGEPPANPMPLEVIVADDFTVGGKTPGEWTTTPATCEARADATQVDARRLLEKTTPDLGAVPVELTGAERLGVSVTLTP